MQTCKEWFTEGLKLYGYSAVENEIKAWKRRRVPEDRPERIRVPIGARSVMYAKQNGLCGICGQLMDGKNVSRLDVDHIDPMKTGTAFNHRSNLQLTHPGCNRSKGAASVPEQAKRYGRTMTDILAEADV